jgi:predicted RNase H-like HicB family nuclease
MSNTGGGHVRGERMQTVKFVYWQEEGAWLGYLQDYPDYWTQGETLDDLKDHLKDLYRDLTSGELPGIRKVDELVVS